MPNPPPAPKPPGPTDPARFRYQPRVPGVDVSSHQPDIPWDRLYEAGHRFAYGRVADGSTQIDAPRLGDPPSRSHYAEHRDGAREAGLDFGPYLFVRCGDKAKLDDQLALLFSQMDLCTLPPALDLEDGSEMKKTNKHDIQSDVLYLIDRVIQQCGRVVVYTAVGWWDRFMNGVPMRRPVDGGHVDVDLWVATYGRQQPLIPSSWQKDGAVLWQWTGDARFVGYDGPIDMNYFRGTESEFKAWVEGVSVEEPVPPIIPSPLPG